MPEHMKVGGIQMNDLNNSSDNIVFVDHTNTTNSSVYQESTASPSSFSTYYRNGVMGEIHSLSLDKTTEERLIKGTVNPEPV